MKCAAAAGFSPDSRNREIETGFSLSPSGGGTTSKSEIGPSGLEKWMDMTKSTVEKTWSVMTENVIDANRKTGLEREMVPHFSARAKSTGLSRSFRVSIVTFDRRDEFILQVS
jgi:hypothetical protein